MKATLRLTRNTTSPSLRFRAATVKNRKPILEAMGQYAVSHAKRAFNEPSLRPSAWPNLARGGAATLRKSNTLARTPRVVTADNGKAVVGSDRKYAAIHQLGGRTPAHTIRPKKKKALAWPGGGPVKKVEHPGSNIPARPYWPFLANGRPAPKFAQGLNGVVKKKLDGMLKKR